ncbi:MAG: hypothetical protein JOZ69_25290 [Myxococcales bacterium]|nr:hypothetical protein [Myxococcales bacterium]
MHIHPPFGWRRARRPLSLPRPREAGRAARSASVLLLLALGTACDKKSDAGGDHPPPPPPLPAASAEAHACADGGGANTDPISAPLVPRAIAGYCLDPQTEPRTYGDKGKLSMDDVCTTAFDGECEVYKRFGLDRVVVLRYVDGSGAPNSVEVNLSRFSSPDGAYGMFTKRVVADADPVRATVKALDAGAGGASSSSNAYVWRGPYLAELTFVTEDTKMTPADMARANELSTGAIARDVGARLPGDVQPLPAAAALPTASRVPLGVAYHPKDALGVPGLGPAAVGYYKDGEKRWRAVAVARGNVEGAKEAFRAFKQRPGSLPLKGPGDEAVHVVLQEAPDRAKAEYVVARKGALVLAVGDEELVLDPKEPEGRQAPLKLTKDEKIQKLAEWVASSK